MVCARTTRYDVSCLADEHLSRSYVPIDQDAAIDVIVNFIIHETNDQKHRWEFSANQIYPGPNEAVAPAANASTVAPQLVHHDLTQGTVADICRWGRM